MPKIVYVDLSDEINNRRFKVRMDGTYQPNIHPYLLDRGTPLYTPQPGTEDISFRTVAQIIDLCDKEVKFALMPDKDLVLVVDLLKAYVEELRPYRSNGDDELRRVLDRAERALHKLSYHAGRVCTIEERKGKRLRKPFEVADLFKLFTGGN